MRNMPAPEPNRAHVKRRLAPWGNRPADVVAPSLARGGRDHLYNWPIVSPARAQFAVPLRAAWRPGRRCIAGRAYRYAYRRRARRTPNPIRTTSIEFMAITYKTPDDIAKLRISGRLAADVLAMIGEHVKAGVSTDELDALCNDYIVNTQKSIPANVGYLGFPKTVCTSVNSVVCHGIPNRSEILKDGDIINIDVAIIKDGYFGDTSRMYCVGQPSTVARQLIDTTYEAMLAGIREVKPGATLGDVGHAIQKVAQRDGFSIVRDYCGHGIGKVYHEDPQVLHYGQPGQGVRLKPGMVFTIEPMINAGRAGTSVQRDGWTVVTKDRSLSAQWEHMIAVTDDGYELLTPWPDGTGSYEAP
jgi:methionyl aminopeptidase